MKKLLSVAAASLIFVGTANAQGTWYTDYSAWLSHVTSTVKTAEYNNLPTNVLANNPYTENGVTVEGTGALWGQANLTSISLLNNTDKMTFTFTGTEFIGNAFGGYFATTDTDEAMVSDNLSFLVDGTISRNLATSSSGYTFLGYISDSNNAITVDVSGDLSPEWVTVDSFSFANGTNATNPGSAVPEPGEYISMAILGIGLCGMLVRSRRSKRS